MALPWSLPPVAVVGMSATSGPETVARSAQTRMASRGTVINWWSRREAGPQLLAVRQDPLKLFAGASGVVGLAQPRRRHPVPAAPAVQVAASAVGVAVAVTTAVAAVVVPVMTTLLQALALVVRGI